MDCGLGLCAGGDCAEAFGTAGESLPNSTDSQRHAFRESAHFTGSRSIRLPQRLTRRPQPVDSVQLLAGHPWFLLTKCSLAANQRQRRAQVLLPIAAHNSTTEQAALELRK